MYHAFALKVARHLVYTACQATNLVASAEVLLPDAEPFPLLLVRDNGAAVAEAIRKLPPSKTRLALTLNTSVAMSSTFEKRWPPRFPPSRCQKRGLNRKRLDNEVHAYLAARY